MKIKKRFKINKLLLAFLSVLTFGLFAIPLGFCASYEQASQLDYANRLSGITSDFSNTSQAKVNLYINNDRFDASPRAYTIQMFNINDLQTPVNIASLSGLLNVNALNNNGGVISSSLVYAYTDNSNYAYYTTNATRIISAWQLVFNSVENANILQNYVFNITLSTTPVYLSDFISNTYYNVGGENNKGIFQYFRVELWQQYIDTTSGEDITSQVVSFNKIQFFEPLVSRIAETNNNNTYQYYIKVYFNNIQVEALPQLRTRYLELSQIRANNVTYTSYSSARSSLSWLNSNMQLYNTDGTFFSSGWNDVSNASRYDTIDWVQFRIVDYTFKSSTYYNSSIGVKGYLANTYFTSLQSSEVLISNESFQNGFDSGYNRGYIDGYASSSANNTNSFSNLFLSIGNVPISIIYNMLNFNILGTNLLSLFTAFITLFLFIWLIKKFRE